jgi:tetratricopeptide (TPR) repeat protein
VKLYSHRHIIIFLVLTTLLAITGCSTQKNTARSRWWHSFNARYNTYYNGTLAYIDGSLEKENGNKDNFTEMIPLYTVTNKNSRELGKSNYETAILKCEKAIHQHSIKKRPEWTKNRRKTAKDIEWLNRKEYNPFLWKAWMLMGRSQFFKGDFDGAAATFAYMSRLYATQPAIYGRARAWLAKCYIEQDWRYDAEDVIRNMQRDSIHWRAQKEWDYTYADYYIHIGDFEQAIPYLAKVIKHEMRRKQKAREWFLMGQLQAAIGKREEAYKAFKHVIRLNPPYELEFNARIAMSEVMAKGNAKKMIARLKRMASSDNNKEYLDQVYYAMGNIYLNEKDTVHAISAYEKGNAKATRSGIEKGVLLLHLGDLYWGMEKYNDAQRCYGEAIGLLDKDRKDYQQLSDRSKVLDELVPHTEAVHLQDSLQALAQMDEKDRNAAIDRVISALKKKEKEEKDKLAEQESNRQQAMNGGNNVNRNNKTNTTSSATNTGQKAAWYFYNPIAVSQGKTQFQRLWGKRENVDNWQRINKTVVAAPEGAEEMTDEMRDSLIQVAEKEDSIKEVTDSAQNDPHKREYYLAQIPFTPEQIAASNLLLEDALYNSGVIFKDKLDNLTLSEKALRRLEDNYKDFEHMDDVYYHLYLLYSRKGMPSTADNYIDKLKKSYPESQWTTLLTDPYYKENAQFGVHIEDSLYAATYEAFKASRYSEAKGVL